MNITTKIAISSLKKNKSKAILIGIAIFITTTLLTILSLSGNGFINYNKKNAVKMYGNYHASYVRVSEKQLGEIKKNAEFINVGKIESFADVESDNMTSNISYLDEEAIRSINFKLSEGKMPTKENEILAPKEFFEKLGYKEVVIGQIIKVPYRVDGKGKVIEKEFIISGFYKADEISNLRNMYRALISEKFYENTIPKDIRSYTVCFKTIGEDSLNYEQMKQKIKTLSKKIGINDKNISINTLYLMWVTDPGLETIGVCIGIGFLIVLFSILVIYNIFYVGIIQKVQEYGKLKAIGTTKRQMKSIILKEGIIISLFSIPLGLIIGYVISDIFLNEFLIKKFIEDTVESEKVSVFNLYILIMVSIISLITVYLSLKKPMKIVSKISPVEAIKYQEANGNKIRKGYRYLNIFKLTISNLIRNKKRTLTTILVMGLSCLMFVVVANIVGSMDPEYDARHRIEKGDFYITLNGALNDETYPENNLNNKQKQNLMGDKFINTIKNINGVEKVEVRRKILVKNITPNLKLEDYYATIEVLSKEDFNSRRKNVKKGEIDYDKSVQENGISYGWYKFFDEFGYKIGQEINLSLYDGDSIINKNFIMQGSTRNVNADFIIAEETFNKLNLKENMITDLFITCKNGKELSVEKALQNLISGSNHYSMISYEDSLKIAKTQINAQRIPLYSLLALLGIIGFMNMANTLITSIITRKRELGILQAIGLSNKQLNKMLQIEGLVFTVGTLLVALILGNTLGYLAFLKFKSIGMMGLNEYKFPILELGIMIVTLLILQTLLSFYMIKSLQKYSLVDRIKYSE